MGSQGRSLPPFSSRVAVLAWVGLLLAIAARAAGASGAVRSPEDGDRTAAAEAKLSPAGTPLGAPGNTPAESLACLLPIETELRARCAGDLRVRWALSASLAARLAAVESPTVTLTQGGDCADRVVVQVDDGSARYLLSGDVEIFGRGLVAARTLRAGEILAAADVREEEAWFPPSMLQGSAAEVEGSYVMRAVPAGRVVAAGDLAPPPLVRRGDVVRVVYRTRAIELRALGTARRDGWLGDRLAVRVEGAQHDCSARVSGPETVEVMREGEGSDR